MQILASSDNKIQVRVVKCSRDAKGKMKYENHDTFDVIDAKPEEVFATCKEAVIRKANQK